MKILIDNGHGYNTAYKRSPDDRLREYAYVREIAKLLEERLKLLGVEAERIVPEDYDVSLSNRIARVNEICSKVGTSRCLFISLHTNAAAGSGWKNARGWTVWVAKNASSQSKDFAKMLYDEAIAKHLQGNRSVPKEHYWSDDFFVLKHTYCPAVLTENLFHNNREDVNYLLSQQGRSDIVDLHVQAIMKYIKKYD